MQEVESWYHCANEHHFAAVDTSQPELELQELNV